MSKKKSITMIVPYHKGHVKFENLTEEQYNVLRFYSESLYGSTKRKSAIIVL